MGGFLRPPVERKTQSMVDHRNDQDKFCMDKSNRDIWYFFHTFTGLLLLGLSVWQIQDGIKLFAQDFRVYSLLAYYWTYLGIIGFLLLVLKTRIMLEAYQDTIDAPVVKSFDNVPFSYDDAMADRNGNRSDIT